MRNDIIAIVCPDIHGRTFWEKISKEYDGSVPFIFLGDYLDPYPWEGITRKEAIANFQEIIDFKKENAMDAEDTRKRNPVILRNDYRIEKASLQLASSDMNITEIAYACGFNDLSYFIKTFKDLKLNKYY